MEIKRADAKIFLIDHFQLDEKREYTDNHVADFFNHVKTVQYDVLNIVGTNTDLVFQSRFNGYKINDVNELLYEKRILVDGWDKMMSIYHMSDYRRMNHVRQAYAQEYLSWYRDDVIQFRDGIFDYIQTNGPINSQKIKIEALENITIDRGWGGKKVQSILCEYLLAKGELGIARKKNRIKYYDTVEKLNYPLSHEQGFNTDEQFLDWYFHRRIHAQGIVREKNNGNWLGSFLSDKTTRKEVIQRLLQNKQIAEVMVEGIAGICYMSVENIECFTKMNNSAKNDMQKQVRFIAPLDNLLWDRQFIKQLFNFEYTWEVYTPVVKRKYGYYVLPILYSTDLIGRIEFRIENNQLQIVNIWYENEDIKEDTLFKKAFEKEYGNFQKYLRL